MSLIQINPDNPQEHKIQEVANLLRKGAVIIYPTDSVYAIGCDIFNHKALERICKIKGVKPEKAQFSFICHDLSNIAEYTRQFDNSIFKLIKKCVPGPFTFILNSSAKVPKLIQPKKKTVGIRIPNNNIPLKIVEALGNPILTTSIKDDDEVLEYTTDPELIHERYEHVVDLVIDGGFGQNEATTVIDCTGSEIEILRQGLGNLDEYL